MGNAGKRIAGGRALQHGEHGGARRRHEAPSGDPRVRAPPLSPAAGYHRRAPRGGRSDSNGGVRARASGAAQVTAMSEHEQGGARGGGEGKRGGGGGGGGRLEPVRRPQGWVQWSVTGAQAVGARPPSSIPRGGRAGGCANRASLAGGAAAHRLGHVPTRRGGRAGRRGGGRAGSASAAAAADRAPQNVVHYRHSTRGGSV